MPKDGAVAHPGGQAAAMAPRRRLAAFGVLMFATFVATLDNQIVATAMPTIVGDLGEVERFSWVIAGYVLAQCVVMPIYGKLGDLLGRKYVTIAAMGIFVAGSLACAFSWSMASLIVARMCQGLGAGGVLVMVFSTSGDLFEPRARARFQAYIGFVYLAGSFTGPALGGFLTETIGWRSIFFVTAPLGLLAIGGFVAFLPRVRPDRQPVIDYAGAAALATTLVLLLVWVDSSRVFGGFASAPSLAFGAAAAILGAAWVRIERRAREPIVPLTLLRQRDLALLLVATFCCGTNTVGLINFHAYFLQMTTGLSPSRAGLFFIAITAGVSIGAMIAGRLMSSGRHFTLPLRCSLGLSAVMLLVLASLPVQVALPTLAIVLTIQGVSTGLGLNATVLGAQVSADPGDLGAATGTISLMRMIGAAVAISVYGAVLSARLGRADLPGVETLTPTGLAALPPAARETATAVFRQGFSLVYLSASGFAALGLAFAAMIRSRSAGDPSSR